MNHHSQNARQIAQLDGQARGGWFLLPLACRAPLIRVIAKKTLTATAALSDVSNPAPARAASRGAGLLEATT